jgi:lipopolysaccharide export system permease protein
MRLLARYLMRECLVALGFCFSAFLMFWIASDLITELSDMQERKMRAGDIAAYYFFRLPEFLPVAIPVALLLALLYSLTNHARHNEITAIRAAGVSLWRLSLPYFAIAAVAGAALFVISEMVAPAASELADNVKERRVRTRQQAESRTIKKTFSFNNSREGRSWLIGRYDKEKSEMLNPAVNWQLRDGTIRRIVAERGVFTNRVWTFYQVREIRRAPGPDSVNVKSQTNVMEFPEFSETPDVIRSEISISERFGHEGRTRRADIPLEAISDYLRLHPNPERSIKAWLYTKWHGRFAAPITCLVVVLLAIPFAAASGRRNVFVGVAASIVIFFAYYILQQVGFAFAEAGRIPPWLGAWTPNLLAAAVGLFMLLRVR